MTGPAARSIVLLLIVGLGMLAYSTASILARSTRACPAAVAAHDDPRAVILAVHGFNDYSHAFADFGAYAASQGIAVHAYDQSGFGANPSRALARDHWPGIRSAPRAGEDWQSLPEPTGLPARREHGGGGADCSRGRRHPA